MESAQRATSASTRWRWAGLVAGVIVYVTAVLTFGLGFLLAPLGLAVSVAAVKRVPRPRGWLPWLWVLVTAALLVPMFIWVVPALLAGGY
jgi:hypothetical protein